MAARLFDQNNELRLNIAAPILLLQYCSPILLLSNIAAQREARRHAMNVPTRRESSCVLRPLIAFPISS